MNQMMPAVYSLTEPNIAISTKTGAHARTQARYSHSEVFALNTDIQNNILKPMRDEINRERKKRVHNHITPVLRQATFGLSIIFVFFA